MKKKSDDKQHHSPATSPLPDAERRQSEETPPVNNIKIEIATHPPTCEASAENLSGELEKLQKEIEELRKTASERDEFLKLLQRVQADFLNYQKRVKREKEICDKYEGENLLRELLPALDNLTRSLKINCTTDEARSIQGGVDLTKKEIFRILSKRGVTQVKTVGETFDPYLHEVVEGIESDEHKENEIVEEISAGYFLHDRLLRPAKVKIAIKPTQKETIEKQNITEWG
ncbi:MAG: nucleotide exchange factor GrpE [Planctomycetota bacterium]|nr:nucleotide exchange factor GrpE [Planctomycetota bacterium]